MSPGETNGSRVGGCVEWVLGGISRRPTAQRCQNQVCLLIRTETPVIKDEICCWI